MSVSFVQWIDRQPWFHAMARILPMRMLASWVLRLRPLSRPVSSGMVVAVTDLESLHLRDEIFQRETYRRALALAGDVRTVIDLGCNVGFFCCYLRHYFNRTDFRGFGIDANLKVLERAERNLELNGLTGIELFHGLVGNVEESLTPDFYVHASHLKSSQFIQVEEGKKLKDWTRVDVPVLMPGEIWRDQFGDQPLDLLKISIEGSEGNLLRADPALFWQTKCVVLKWHKRLVEPEELFPILEDFGFNHREALEKDADTELWFFSRKS